MSDKALNNAELELTQRIQMHFPRGISSEVLARWNGCPKEVITARLAEVFENEPVPDQVRLERPLLIPVGTATVVATTTSFVARDRFVVNTKKNAPVKISYLGDNFNDWFLGKEEQPFGGSTLNHRKLSRSSVDGPIIAELGGEAKAETTLTELFSLMEAQKNSESGPLLMDGYANIFYIREAKGVLRTVGAFWDGGGWSVCAFPVGDPDEWRGARQVFSRNS